MASPIAHLGNKPQLSYDSSVQQRNLHTGKIKAKTQLFRKAGPAFRGFQYEDCYRLTHQKLVSLIQTHENEEKQLEKDLLTIQGLSCARCTLPFSFQNHLKIHSYFCGNPNIVAGDLKALKKHHGSLQEQGGGMLFCPWCPRLYSNMETLLKHVRRCREARRERDGRRILKRLPCPECCSEFSHLQKLSNHMQTHYVADFTCSGCKLSFTTAKYLAVHLISCEKIIPPYRCSECRSTFSHAKALRMHVLSCRTSVQCLKCARFFPGKSLCLEHVVMHILSEWSKVGLQMIDGILYSIMHHKRLQENVSELPFTSVSPCSSPEPVESQERPVKPNGLIANSRSRSPLEQRSCLNSDKAPSSLDKLVKLLHAVKGNNLPQLSSNTVSDSILTREPSLQSNLEDSGNTKKYNCTLQPDIALNSKEAFKTLPDSPPEGMQSGDEDNLSVIENEVYEIEHTLDEDEFFIEQEMCDKEPSLPTYETGKSFGNSVETTFEMRQEHSDVAQLFTPATDVESEDSNKLTLTVVNVEGGANLFDWDDCNSEENNFEITETGESQFEMHDFISVPPAETGSDVLLGVDSHSDGNEDGDSGIGATDDNDSNKDRSEVLDKYGDVISNHSEMLRKLPVVPGKAGAAPCPLALSEVFVSSSSCDTEIVIESSPTMQTESTEFSLVIPRSYSVQAEHSYASPLNLEWTPDATQGTERFEKKCKNALKMSVSEHQGDNVKSRKQKKQRVWSSGKSIKGTPKFPPLNVGEEIKPPAMNITEQEQDPLQKILEVMSKEARQTLAKKSKSLKPPSFSRKSIPIKHPHSFDSTTIATKEQSSAKINLVSGFENDTAQKNVVPICEDNIASDHSLAHLHLADNIAVQSLLMLNESVQATPSSDECSMALEETELQHVTIPDRPPSECTSQDIILDRPLSQSSTQDIIPYKPPSECTTQDIILDRPPSECTTVERPSQDDFIERVKPPMSIDKMLRKERSLLKNGFKQIATVLPQRKESDRSKEVSIRNIPVADFAAVNQVLPDKMIELASATNTVRPVSNIIYIQLPPGTSAVPPLVTSVASRIPKSFLAKLRPIAPTTSTRKSYVLDPASFPSQIQQKPSEVVSSLRKPDSDVTSRSTSAPSDVQLAPNSSIAAQPVRSNPRIIYTGAKGMVPMSKDNAVSGIVGRPVFAKILPTNCSSAVSADVTGMSLADSYLNVPSSEEMSCSKENLPPIQEASNVPTNEFESEPKMECAMLQKSKQFESNSLKQDLFGNYNRSDTEDNASVRKESSTLADLVDASAISLESTLNSHKFEATLCCKENLSPIQESSDLSVNESEKEVNMESTMLQKSKQLESSISKQDVSGNCGSTNSEGDGPVIEASSAVTNLLDVLNSSNLHKKSSEEAVCTKGHLSIVEESSHLPPNEHESEMKNDRTMLQKSQQFEMNHSNLDDIGINRINFDDNVRVLNSLSHGCSSQLDAENMSETTAVKAVEDQCRNLVNEEVKQLKGNNDLEMDLLETAVAPSSSYEDGFEGDVCNDAALDHEIKALISCLDSNIALEETRGPEDLTFHSEQSASVEIPLAENLQALVSERNVVEKNKIHDVPNKTDPKLNLAQSKLFEVCSMQLCNSKHEDEFSMNSFTTVGNTTEDTRLAKNENASVCAKTKRSTISHTRTNMYASRKLMAEMKYFKRRRHGREGLYQSNDVSRFNCNHCSQWFYSQTNLDEHICLKAIIREKFTSEQFDQLIDAINKTQQQVQCAQNLVQENDNVDQSQLTPNSVGTYVSPYLSYLQMKATVRHKKFICEKCKIRCKSFSALLEHKSSAHDEKYTVECHICAKRFARLQQLAVHVAKSHRVKSDSSMDTPSQPLRSHVVKSSLFRKTAVPLTKRHQVRRGSYIKIALQMARKTPSKNLAGPSLKATELMDESSTAQSSPSKESDDPSTVLKEIPGITGSSNPESIDKSSQCSLCSKYFKGKAGLTSHMVQVHRENPSPCNDDDVTQCSICNKLFKGKGGLTSHMNQAHRETFKCPLCLRRFCYVQTLKFHLSKHHSSSLNTDAFVSESVEPANNVECSPSKLVSPEDINNSTVKDVLANAAENSLGTPNAEDYVLKSPCNTALPEEENQQQIKKTKWKFVRDTSSSPEQPATKSAVSIGADNYACNTRSGNASPNKSDIKKPKKIKWRIVKDHSPEKLSSPERPAKSPRLTDSGQAPVPSLVMSFSKVKKHRHKCSLCKKHFKKHQHLVQHRIGAHKFRSEHQPQSHVEQSYTKHESASLAEDQDAQVVPQNCPINDVAVMDKNMCAAEKENVFEFGNPRNSQSSSESATIEANTSSVDSIAPGRGENINEEQANCPNPADELSKEEMMTSDPAPSIPSETAMEELVAPPPQPNSHNGKFKCDMCQLEFSAKGYFERHNIKVHGATCKFKCTLCDKIFVDIRSLRFHTKLKHKKKKEEDKGAKTQLSSHAKLKTSQESMCDKLKTIQESTCDLCNKTFTRRSDLRRHKQTVHKTAEQFKCCTCQLPFKSDELLAAHNSETHSEGSEEKTLDSLFSPKESNDVNQEMVNLEGMAAMERESADIKEELEIYKCQDCSLTYRTVSCLKRHRILMHAEQASHTCDVCGKGFSYPHSLKNHMMTHSWSEPTRKSRRSIRSKYPQEDWEVGEPSSNCGGSVPSWNRSAPAVVETEADVPIIPVSETSTKSDMSDCHTSDEGKLGENLAEPEAVSKMPDQEHSRPATTSQDEELQQYPAPVENISHQENGSCPFTDSCASVNFNSGSTSGCSVPMENYSLNNSYSKTDEPPASYDAGKQSADKEWMPAPQAPQYQMPSMLSLSAPSVPSVHESPVTPSFDQAQAFNNCALCGLCLPSWYALQEHFYVFHSFPNFYAPAAPPAPMPYAASLNYSAYPSQNAAYSGWTQQHQLTAVAPSGVVNDGTASFQELTSQSGAHCSVCGLVFPSLLALQEHYATHMAAPKPAVQYCGGFY